jgi:tetratricopeptide (TPR) repeat protein
MLEALNPAWRDAAEVRWLQGRCERQEGRADEALKTLDDLLSITDHSGGVHLEMAQCHLDRNELQSARDCLEVAVTLSPESGEAWWRLGEVLYRLESPGALSAFQEAVERLKDPQALGSAWFRIGQMEFDRNQVENAARSFELALQSCPDSIDTMTALADTLMMLDREDEAVKYYERALEHWPEPPRHVLANMGSALHYTGLYAEAAQVFLRVLAGHPNDHVARCSLGQLQLAQCIWSDGWDNFSARYSSGAVPFRPMPYPQWKGQCSARGTLLVLADEGIGDEIMYASCLQDAAKRVGQVIVECEPRLTRLFSRSFPQVKVVGTERQNDSSWLKGLPQPDWQVPASELPALFRRSDSDFPVHDGYISAEPERVAFWRSRLMENHGAKWKVGISWRGGTVKTRGRARTMSPQSWRPILDQENIAFVNLQYGRYEEELAALNRLGCQRVHDYPQADFDETAALVASLDLVVTVCTTVVHLAGALGQPVWVLTPLSPGWRYTTARDTMPWYPSSVLFRQPELGRWDAVCQKLADQLRLLTNSVTLDRRSAALKVGQL